MFHFWFHAHVFHRVWTNCQAIAPRLINYKTRILPERCPGIAEIFLSSHKPGSPIEAIARDAAVTVSIALQFGAELETIRAALTRDHGGPATALGAALDAIAGAAP